jgi:SNF2 family DNA or RNA helicase
MKFIAHDYQIAAINFIKEKRNCALFLEMGLGKTVTTLTALQDLHRDYEAHRILIVAPLRVANMVWQQEIDKWDHINLTSAILTGPAAKRASAAQGAEDIHIINYENLVWLITAYGKKWPYETVVFDELSKLKAPGSKRFKTLKRLRPRITQVIGLTGTPASNGLIDLWSQTYLLDEGLRLGKTFTSFKSRWFEADYFGHKWTPKPSADAQIHKAISDIVISMSAADYLTLPEYLPVTEPVELPKSVVGRYQTLQDDMFVELSKGDVTAVNAAVLSSKCMQLTNGALYLDEQDGTWEQIHDAKLDALEEIIELACEPVLVDYNFQSDLARLKERFPNAVQVDSKGEAVERWNKGEIDILLAHPASAGHGLNLQAGGSRIVWFGLNWSLELYEQFNARLYRQGQTKPVTVHHLIVPNTVDEIVMDRLLNKKTVQDALKDALKYRSKDENNHRMVS